jgi:hypothetical protein
LDLYFPSVQIDTASSAVSGPKRIPAEFKLRMNRALSNPTGFSYSKAMTIELINQRSAAAFTSV